MSEKEGLLARLPLLSLTGLALLFWFAWEWLLFTVRASDLARGVAPRTVMGRQIRRRLH